MTDRLPYPVAPQSVVVASIITVLCWLPGTISAAAEWRVPQSDYRLVYRVISQPSHPQAGIYIRVPDAGLLPDRFEVVVYSDRGEQLPAFLVWHNPGEAAGVVVSKPATEARDLSVYVKPGATEPWRERAEQAPRPGPFLYTEEQRNPTLNQAIALSRTITTFEDPTRAARMGMVPNLHYEENPFGSQNDFVSYFTAWLDIREPGNYYFATVSNAGSMIRVNDQQVVRIASALPRRDMRLGQRGGTIELRRGLNRVEYFQFFGTGRNPEMLLAWRTPAASRDSMPQVVPRSAFVRSGETVLMNAQSLKNLPSEARAMPAAAQKGTPPSVIEFRALSFLWPEDAAEAMVLFSIEPWNHSNHGADVNYRWYLDDQLISEDAALHWIVEGRAPIKLRLEVSNPAGVSSSTRDVTFVHAPRRATPNRESDRSRYRQALINQLKAKAQGVSPAWSTSHLTLIPEIVEPFQDDDGLLALLLEVSPGSFNELSATDRRLLEESLFFATRRLDPIEAQQLAARFRTMNSDEKAKFRWSLEDVRLQLYELDQPEQALRALHSAQPPRPTDEQAFAIEILRGDVYRYQGKTEQATSIYAEAAKRSVGRQRRSSREIPEWRENTVRSASYFTRIREMVREGFYPEASELLRQWEWENPQQKVNGDFVVAEASFFLALKDYRRARAIASSLRKRDVIDNFLPTAIRIEAEALAAMGEVEALEELRQNATQLIPGHDVLEHILSLLQRIA